MGNMEKAIFRALYPDSRCLGESKLVALRGRSGEESTCRCVSKGDPAGEGRSSARREADQAQVVLGIDRSGLYWVKIC